MKIAVKNLSAWMRRSTLKHSFGGSRLFLCWRRAEWSAWEPSGELISPFGRLGIAYYANPTGYDNPNESAFIPATTAQTLQFQLMGK
jgi:hypothetical protein